MVELRRLEKTGELSNHWDENQVENFKGEDGVQMGGKWHEGPKFPSLVFPMFRNAHRLPLVPVKPTHCTHGRRNGQQNSNLPERIFLCKSKSCVSLSHTFSCHDPNFSSSSIPHSN